MSVPATEGQSANSLLGVVPDALRGPLVNLLVSGPLVTVGLYVFGRRFTRQFYWRFGIDDAALDFSVQDYVIRSEAAFFELIGSVGWLVVLVALAAWALLRSARAPKMSSPLRLGLLAALGIAGFAIALSTAPSSDDTDTALLWWFALSAIVGVRAVVGILDEVASGSLPLPTQIGATLAIAALLLIALTEGAQREGLRFACERERDRHRSQPISLLAPEPLNVGSMEPYNDRILHTDLRLFTKTPAGYLVFGALQSPSNSGLTLVPADTSVTVQFKARHEELLADPGAECAQILRMNTATERPNVDAALPTNPRSTGGP